MPVSTKLQVRRDIAATWTSTNPTLASGEIGFETDTLKFKIGNGSTAWASLAYQGSSGTGTGTVTSIATTSPITGGTITTSGTIGINASSASTANFVVQRDANASFVANTITANLSGTASLATYIVGGTSGSLPYQNATNTTTFLSAPATNNSVLTYNTATGAPEWDSPQLTMAVLMGYTSTVTAAGTTTLTNASTYYQQFTGTTTQTVSLPDTSTLVLGWTFHIVNNSTGLVTVRTSSAAQLLIVPAGTTAMVTCVDITVNTIAAWEAGLTDFSTYTGSGSVVMSTSPSLTTPALGVATGTSVNVTGQFISTNAGAPLAVSNATTVANLTATYAIRGAIVGNTAPTVANTSNMARIYVSSTAPVDTLITGDIWISF